MDPIDTYKYFGIASFLLLAIGLAVIPNIWPLGIHASFSQHIAGKRSSIIYYVVLFLLTLPIFQLFIYNWFIPTIHAPIYFGHIVATSCIFQIACTLVPETGGSKTRIHRLLAGASGILLIPALIILITANTLDALSTILLTTGLGTMVVVLYILKKGDGRHPRFLVLQAAYFSAFFLPILIIAYVTT